MTMKLRGRNGVLRIYDSTGYGHGKTIFSGYTPHMVQWDGAAAWTDITAPCATSGGTLAEDVLTDTNDAVFVGSDYPFSTVFFNLWTGDAGVATGAMKMYYFDGTDFSNEVKGLIDRTENGGDCLAQNGDISFLPGADWAIGANSVNANLDSDKYYVKIMCTTNPSTNPDADMLRPEECQFYEIPFVNMDFSGPIGRALTEEILVMNRGKMDAFAHYIEGIDDKIYEAIPLSFSCSIDDTYNNEQIFVALECGNPGTTYWTGAGSSSKGITKNDGINFNPGFVDAGKKCVNIQMLFEGIARNIGFAFYEVFFPPDEQTIAEGDDALTLSCNGGVYGLIEKIAQFASRE